MTAKFNGKKLKALREAKHITQEALAEQADLGDRYIRELESGSKSNPSAKLICQMAHALEVPMEEFMEVGKDETAL